MTTSKPSTPVHIIGGGLAGSEAAWQLANHNVPVILHEMRPHRPTEVHKTDYLAELVCSNSFRSDDHEANAVGVLHQEMRMLNSLIMAMADQHCVPAGGALAVDRDGFAMAVENAINNHHMITLEREEIESLDAFGDAPVIVATGPLTASPLAAAIREATGEEDLAFFDAIAPIVYRESINMDKAWFQSRYDKGSGKDYINCPLEKEEYETFIAAMLDAEKISFHQWEENTPYFNGCMPIEVMAERGHDTPRFGPMKPVGLTNPQTGKRPYAVIQLRQDNALGTLYNIVGFQTKMKYADQIRVFRMIPGLEDAEFARLGGLHRNTFIRSPKLLDKQLRLKSQPNLRFAGQITGVEGYVESAAIGLMAGRMIAADYHGEDFTPPPPETAHGALLDHITGGAQSDSFQPMNINFGLFALPPEDMMIQITANGKKRKLKGADRKSVLARRALSAMSTWSDQPEFH